MAKYRLCGGMAMMPGRDMALLESMSARGWHVRGLNALLCYRFEQGEPHAYEYALGYEQPFAPEVEELYRAGGWTLVVAGPDWQILRAEAGTTPLFTDGASEIEALSVNRRRVGKWALVWLAVLLASGAWMAFDDAVAVVPIAAAAAGLVCTVLPCIGYTRSIAKLRARR